MTILVMRHGVNLKIEWLTVLCVLKVLVGANVIVEWWRNHRILVIVIVQLALPRHLVIDR